MHSNRYTIFPGPGSLHRGLSTTYVYNQKVTNYDPRSCTDELEKIERMKAFIRQHQSSESHKAMNYAYKFGIALDQTSTINLAKKTAWLRKYGADPQYLTKLNEFITKSQDMLSVIQMTPVQSPNLAAAINEARLIHQYMQHELQHTINELTQEMTAIMTDIQLNGNNDKTVQKLERAIQISEDLAPNMCFALSGTRELATTTQDAEQLLSALLLDNLSNSYKL